jgi:hypothetical protein
MIHSIQITNNNQVQLVNWNLSLNSKQTIWMSQTYCEKLLWMVLLSEKLHHNSQKWKLAYIIGQAHVSKMTIWTAIDFLTYQICLRGKTELISLETQHRRKDSNSEQDRKEPTRAGLVLYLLLPAGVRCHSFFATINTLGIFSSTSKTRKRNGD